MHFLRIYLLRRVDCDCVVTYPVGLVYHLTVRLGLHVQQVSHHYFALFTFVVGYQGVRHYSVCTCTNELPITNHKARFSYSMLA